MLRFFTMFCLAIIDLIEFIEVPYIVRESRGAGVSALQGRVGRYAPRSSLNELGSSKMPRF